MTKQDIIDTMAKKTGQSKAASERMLNAAIEAIKEGVARDGNLVLTNFCSFTVISKAERKGRNPRTGETMVIPARKFIKFKPGKSFDEKVNV